LLHWRRNLKQLLMLDELNVKEELILILRPGVL